MLNLFAVYQTDENLEVNGTWVDFQGKSRLLVAREGNVNYVKLLSKLHEENQLALDAGGDEADKLDRELLAEVFARTILLGWEGITFDGKNETPYTVENAKKALRMKDFMFAVQAIARDISNYRGKIEKEQAKN